jgi:hypothetical protein
LIMRKILLAAFVLSTISSNSQNIFSGEPVQVVGSFNGYATTPYATDYRTTTYRRLSITSGTPTDGRGQWATTINVQNAGGDVGPVNMPGGAGNGFLFISGPSANRFLNKWVFSGVGQGAVDAINNITAYNSGNDMGLNMSTTGYYTFVFNDCGYTQSNSRYYVGYTSSAPVNVSRTSRQYLSGGYLKLFISTSSAPSAEEKIYIRYNVGSNDFSGTSTTSLVQATGSGTSWEAIMPIQTGGTMVFYYVFSSTRSLAQLTANTEAERSIAALRYDDNAGATYSYIASALPVNFTQFYGVKENGMVKLNWAAGETDELSHYELESANTPSDFRIKSKTDRIANATDPVYTAYDYAPYNGSNFYRVAAVAKDGSKKYSQILTINTKASREYFKLLPQQQGGGFAVIMNGMMAATYQLAVYSNSGQLMYSRNIVSNGADQSIVISTGVLKAGQLYRVVLRGAGKVYNEAIYLQ